MYLMFLSCQKPHSDVPVLWINIFYDIYTTAKLPSDAVQNIYKSLSDTHIPMSVCRRVWLCLKCFKEPALLDKIKSIFTLKFQTFPVYFMIIIFSKHIVFKYDNCLLLHFFFSASLLRTEFSIENILLEYSVIRLRGNNIIFQLPGIFYQSDHITQFSSARRSKFSFICT